jgi:hypothetical protein
MFRYFFVISFIAMISNAIAGSLPERPSLMKSRTLQCGEKNTAPTAWDWNKEDIKPRQCGPAMTRSYVPKYKGIGFDILNYESDACFVPDQSFQLLDTIVDKVVERVTAANISDQAQKVLLISRTTSDVLTEMGFALWIPTDTLSDALILRRTEADKLRHIFDCDTGSMILLTIAEALGVEASLVESTIPGKDPKEFVQHNFVRWPIVGQDSMNWDMNFKEMCSTPTIGQLPFQGKELSKQQFWAYETSLRGKLWERKGSYTEASRDYLLAMRTFPEHPGAFDGFAWVVATKVFPERSGYSDEALTAALKAVAVREDPNFLDTLACVYAYKGNFTKAAATEERAVRLAPKKYVDDFSRRLKKFGPTVLQDCTGEP